MRLVGTEADLLARVMDASVKRHETTARNLANINTPGYRAQEVRFEESFREALEDDQSKALEVRPEIAEVEGLHVKADGNNVVMEREFSLMQRNAAVFNVMNSVLRQKFAMVKQAISGSPR